MLIARGGDGTPDSSRLIPWLPLDFLQHGPFSFSFSFSFSFPSSLCRPLRLSPIPLLPPIYRNHWIFKLRRGKRDKRNVGVLSRPCHVTADVTPRRGPLHLIFFSPAIPTSRGFPAIFARDKRTGSRMWEVNCYTRAIDVYKHFKGKLWGNS